MPQNKLPELSFHVPENVDTTRGLTEEFSNGDTQITVDGFDATYQKYPQLNSKGIMLLSGAGGGDDWVLTGEQLEEIYDDISSDKVMLRRKDTPHGEMLYSANGSVAAWFLWQLQGDEYAAKAFSGANAEILSNKFYQDQQ